MFEWGWRIPPFLIAGPLGLVGLYIRLKLSDTAEFERLQASGEVSESPPVKDALATSRRQILQVVGCIALQAAAFYFIFVYMETYLQSEVGFSFGLASASTVTCLCSAAVAIFVFARISDRYGRKPVIILGAVSSTLIVYPAFLVFATGKVPPAIVVAHARWGSASPCSCPRRAQHGGDLPESCSVRRILDRIQHLGRSLRRHRTVCGDLSDRHNRQSVVTVGHSDRDGRDGHCGGGDAARNRRPESRCEGGGGAAPPRSHHRGRIAAEEPPRPIP